MGIYGWIDNDTVRAIIGSLTIIGLMICSVICIYKYAICQEEINKRNRVNIQPPRVYSSGEVKSHQTTMIVIPSQPYQPSQSSQSSQSHNSNPYVGIV